MLPWQKGLSPRMRGNRQAVPHVALAEGSIPAHAGKPGSFRTWSSVTRVYPRACGETGSGGIVRMPGRGLSPRMRGNLEDIEKGPPGSGSIPAHAGKPRSTPPPPRRPRVYPRACGETSPPRTPPLSCRGLSPRMRGNLAPALQEAEVAGSIPAHAGKPRGNTVSIQSMRVYPRACGETEGLGRPLALHQGLSPRMRGNRVGHGRGVLGGGSIPAHAGKPPGRSVSYAVVGVYPRACGETGRS